MATRPKNATRAGKEDQSTLTDTNYNELARRARKTAEMAEREAASSMLDAANAKQTGQRTSGAGRGNNGSLIFLGLALLGGAIWMTSKTVTEIRPTSRKASRPSPQDGATISHALPSWFTPADMTQFDYDLVPFDAADEDYGRGYIVQRLRDDKWMSWQIHNRRQGFESIAVSGESHHLDDLQANSFRPPARLTLVPEPDNPHDPHAVAIWDAAQQHQAGYIPRDEAERIGMRLRRGHVVECLSMWEKLKDGQRVSLRLLLLYQEAKVRRPPMPTRT